MASTVLYPPIVNSIAPAFVASGDSSSCKLYFSLSKYSSTSQPIKALHISVIKQSTGQSVVRKVDDPANGRYRSTGIIIINTEELNKTGTDNLYYVDILNNDVQAGDQTGWYPGWLYKIQIRLSDVPYDGSIGQSAYLNVNASHFSEWSTYCTTKAISKPRITIPVLNGFDSNEEQSLNRSKEYNLSLTTLTLDGTYSNADESETLYSYDLSLYNLNDELIENSDMLFSNQYYSPNQFHYIFKTELRDSEYYNLVLHYTTINKYEETFKFKILASSINPEAAGVKLVSVETIETVQDEDFKRDFNESTSLEFEQEEGLIGLKIYSKDSVGIYNGNFCIRRASSKDNFKTWEDMKIIVCINKPINDLPIFFDKTAESGVWYKYGIQSIDTNGFRSRLEEIKSPILREWEYSYLIGEGGRQLKLKYNNVMNSYTYNFSESKTDTIGGQYPYITRNGNTKYRTFPVNGLISFNMDENELFTSDLDMYGYQDIVSLYRRRRKAEYIFDYDYRREFDFREKVLDFLQDGKPKLFKSATEGNIIIRLMQVAAQPNQSLNRMIYSFTSTAHEVAADTIENYLKYGFFEVGNYATSFVVYSTHIGQIQLDCQPGDNIIEKIWAKYDFSTKNLAGLRNTLLRIHHLRINFTDKPLKVYNNVNELVIGNNFTYNNAKITVRGDLSRTYVFDEDILLTEVDKVCILGAAENVYDEFGNVNNTVHVDVDFLYDMAQDSYIGRAVRNRIAEKGIGQVYASYAPGTDVYRDVYYKYFYDWSDQYRVLAEIRWTCIEANPGAIFLIKDYQDTQAAPEDLYHEINQTGVLNLEGLGEVCDIKYIGMRNPDGSIDETKDVDVIVDYLYYTIIGIYSEEA